MADADVREWNGHPIVDAIEVECDRCSTKALVRIPPHSEAAPHPPQGWVWLTATEDPGTKTLGDARLCLLCYRGLCDWLAVGWQQ